VENATEIIHELNYIQLRNYITELQNMKTGFIHYVWKTNLSSALLNLFRSFFGDAAEQEIIYVAINLLNNINI
jgi:hypothetical protein